MQEIQRARSDSQVLGGYQIFQADGSLKSDVAGIFISQKSTNSANPGFIFFQRASLAAHGCGKVQVGREKAQELVCVKCGGRNSAKKTSKILENNATRGPSFQTPGSDWDSSIAPLLKALFRGLS